MGTSRGERLLRASLPHSAPRHHVFRSVRTSSGRSSSGWPWAWAVPGDARAGGHSAASWGRLQRDVEAVPNRPWRPLRAKERARFKPFSSGGSHRRERLHLAHAHQGSAISVRRPFWASSGGGIGQQNHHLQELFDTEGATWWAPLSSQVSWSRLLGAVRRRLLTSMRRCSRSVYCINTSYAPGRYIRSLT